MTTNNDEPFISIQGITKKFGEVTAVDAVDLDIASGELFSILGGSGCGKTTLLRIMAGFEEPSAGSIHIDGVDITELPPYKRPVNMMFQSYAIFPHMTVEQNVAYGLKKEKVQREELESRVNDILELVKMTELRRRKPDQLSGGQRQRVALARALVKRPKVLLLDEPLAALDKKLREHTQFELMNIQDELGITFIVVTHDQEEAMILSNRIAIMEEGRFMQIGPPREVYEYPNSRFVADFIGTINMFDGEVETVADGKISVRSTDAPVPLECESESQLQPGDSVAVAVRPEKIFISQKPPDNSDDVCIAGVVQDLGYFGNLSLYRIKLETGKVIQASAQNRRRSAERSLEWDDAVYVSWRRHSAVLLTD